MIFQIESAITRAPASDDWTPSGDEYSGGRATTAGIDEVARYLAVRARLLHPRTEGGNTPVLDHLGAGAVTAIAPHDLAADLRVTLSDCQPSNSRCTRSSSHPSADRVSLWLRSHTSPKSRRCHRSQPCRPSRPFRHHRHCHRLHHQTSLHHYVLSGAGAHPITAMMNQ